jgi:hypothetical protein
MDAGKKLTNDQRKAAEEAEAIMRDAAAKASAKLTAVGLRPHEHEEGSTACRECSCPEFKPKFSNPFQCRQEGCNHSVPFHMPI